MFDLGLSELMVIAVVALVVIGPERLPKVARTAGLLLGRLQRYVSDVKSDINREMQLDELKKMQQQMTEQVQGIESSVTHDLREVESSLTNTIAPLGQAATDSPLVPGLPAPEAPAAVVSDAAPANASPKDASPTAEVIKP